MANYNPKANGLTGFENLFKVLKSNNIDKVLEKSMISNRMYISKETDTKGIIYFDYDENTRLEIGGNKDVFFSTQTLVEDGTQIIAYTNLRKFDNDGGKSNVIVDDISVGSFITDGYIIAKTFDINVTHNGTKVIKARTVYKPRELSYTDYYGTTTRVVNGTTYKVVSNYQ